MENYINMNDSFGNKHSVSSTKSFRTYEESVQTLKEQLYNHQKALETAQSIVEQYQQQNQRLLEEINTLKQAKTRIEQKYEVLEGLFIKLDKAKEKQLHKQAKRTQQKHDLQIENLNAKYEQHICGLNQRIFFLELQLHKYQNKQKKYQNLLNSYQHHHATIQPMNFQYKNIDRGISHLHTQTVITSPPLRNKRQQTDKYQDSLEKPHVKTPTKQKTSSPYQESKHPRGSIKSTKQSRTVIKSQKLTQDLTKGQIMISRGSLDRNNGQSRNTEYKERNTEYKDMGGSFERKQMRHSQVRVNTAEDYFSQKFHGIKSVQKPKQLFIYDNNFTDYKDYRDNISRY